MTQKKRLYWGNENLNLPPLDLPVQRESYEQFNGFTASKKSLRLTTSANLGTLPWRPLL